MLDRFEPEAAAAGVRLECRLDGDRPVLAGRDQLSRVLANLVVNGIRHTPRGGRLRVAVAGGDGTAILQVTDSCGGIPEADLPRVFDQLWRGDPARSTKGAGLGLAIARGLVDAHGGTIAVANVPGGCEFTVRLPWSTSAPTMNGQQGLSGR
ncbi:MAG TPA: sensor histidine kinase [Actinomycetes bacterium]|nr:sensor histidine kinase [Actinomycetes bacterium]